MEEDGETGSNPAHPTRPPGPRETASRATWPDLPSLHLTRPDGLGRVGWGCSGMLSTRIIFISFNPTFPRLISLNLPIKCELNFSNHSWRSKVFLTNPKHTDVCKLEVTTHSSNFWFYCVGDYNRNVNSGLEGSNLEIKLGLVIEPPLKSSLNDKMSSSFKRGAMYLLKSTHKSWTITWWFFGKFCNLRQRYHNCAPSAWICTHQHMSN